MSDWDGYKKLKELIDASKFDEALGLIKSAVRHQDAERFVLAVFESENSTPELVEAVLRVMLDSRENRYRQHGFWVHSVSHFTDELWKRRLDSWIVKFNEAAFRGANELDDDNCSDRLVQDFAYWARWDDDPKDFYLQMENLDGWIDWEYHEYARERIQASPFASEVAYLRWEIEHAKNRRRWSNDAQVNLPDFKRFDEIVARLQELGEDVSMYQGVKRSAYETQIEELRVKLAELKYDPDMAWKRDASEKGIALMQEHLASLS